MNLLQQMTANRNWEPARRVGVRRTNPRSPIRNVVTPVDCRKRGKSVEAPLGCRPKPGLLGPDSLLSGGLPAIRRIEKVLPHLVGVKCFIDYTVAVEFF